MAFLYFKEKHCDLVVLECGLGGLKDATNIIPSPLCAVFTSIGEDHLGILGNTIKEIAEDKAGIIKPGCQVISSAQEPEVTAILKEKAAQQRCPFYQADAASIKIISENYTGFTFQTEYSPVLHCGLAGRYQKENLSVVLKVIQVLRSIGYPVSDQAMADGFAKVTWPGRFTQLSHQPLFFVDGAHNVPAAKQLYETVTSYFPGKKIRYIMGVFRDKQYHGIAQIMGSLAQAVYTVPLPDRERSLPAGKLAQTMTSYCLPNTKITPYTRIDDAVTAALSDAGTDDIILAFGSLSYLGEVMKTVQTYHNNHSQTPITEMRTEG